MCPEGIRQSHVEPRASISINKGFLNLSAEALRICIQTNMDLLTLIFLIIISLSSILFRRPFQNFPLDDDFSIYTYRARFASQGFQWKKDLQIIGIPMWKMLLLDKLYGSKEGGVQRIRHLQTAFHLASSLAIYGALWNFTNNPWASFTGGFLYSFYGTSPDLTAGSFNFEQFYIPFVFSGLALLQAGPEWVVLAGLCFGLATIPKYTTALFTGALAPLVWFEFGGPASVQFILTSTGVVTLSNLIEWKLGFWDAESRKQMKTRMATTLRLTRTKNMHFSVLFEIGQLFKQALPIWLGFIPLGYYFVQAQNLWLLGFTLVLFSMIIFQRAFSRYHYLPLFGLLSLACGLGMDAVLTLDPTTTAIILISFGVLLVWNIKSMDFYYLRPTAPETLIHYEKFDQYLYLPRLGKILKRLMRMRGESGERIFVWGTFSQIYHLTDSPASDNFLHHTIGPWDTQDLEGFYDSFMGGLLHHKPRYLIKSFTDLDVQHLEKITGLRYKLLKVVLARFPIYRLEAVSSPLINPLDLPWQEKMHHLEYLTQGEWHAPGLDRSDEERGKQTIALRECRKLVKLNKLDAGGYDYMGDIYNSMSLTGQAEKEFENALKVAPDWPKTRLKLCNQKIKLNKLDEAITLLDEETKRFGYDLEIAFLNGLVQKLKNNFAKALKEFEKIRQQEPARHECWEYCVECMQNLNDRDGLSSLYTKAKDVNNTKDREWLQTLIANSLAKVDSSLRPEHQTLELYLQKDSKNEILRYALASSLEKSGNSTEAYKLFEELATSSQNHSHIQANAWFRMAKLSTPEKQPELLRQCLKHQPSHQGAKDLLKNNPQTVEVMEPTIQNSVINAEKVKINPKEGFSLKVSVVVPNWNGMKFVGMCLDSLAKLDFEDYEVIVVDNGSRDGSREMIEEQYPHVRLLKLPDNMGFAIACNEGIKASRAEYVVLLNNDIEVTSNWLRELYEGMERHPECGMGTTKMMFLDQRDVFYNTGDLFHSWSAGGGRGQGEKDLGQYDREEYVFGACAGAGIYRRDFFNKVGLFDEDFFIFAEDVDLNMRGQLLGLKTVYLPKAKVYHIGTATVGLYSDRYVYLCKRNDIWVFIKNYSLSMYFKYLYSIWKHQFTDVKYFTYRGQGQVLCKSKWDALKMLPQMLFRRFQIQRSRTFSDSEIKEHIITD
jgi:GT2 family glycosyltransferase/tetratricopeptide (TPR) repeat protein